MGNRNGIDLTLPITWGTGDIIFPISQPGGSCKVVLIRKESFNAGFAGRVEYKDSEE